MEKLKYDLLNERPEVEERAEYGCFDLLEGLVHQGLLPLQQEQHRTIG